MTPLNLVALLIAFFMAKLNNQRGTSQNLIPDSGFTAQGIGSIGFTKIMKAYDKDKEMTETQKVSKYNKKAFSFRKTILREGPAYFLLIFLLWGCGGADDQPPSGKPDVTRRATSSSRAPDQTKADAGSPGTNPPQATSNISIPWLNALNVKPDSEVPSPKDQERSDLLAAIDEALNEPDIDSRRSILLALKSEIDKYPDIQENLKKNIKDINIQNLRKYHGKMVDNDPNAVPATEESGSLMDPARANASPGESTE